MTVENTLSLIEMIAAAYPRFEVLKSEDTITVWHECLEDLEYGKAKEATKNVIRVSEFPPTIAQIRADYENIERAEREVLSQIKQSYSNIRSYYPGCGELNYGWEEFKARAKTPEQARRLSQAIFAYVRQCESERKDVVDFAECIKGIQREIQGAEERLVIRND